MQFYCLDTRAAVGARRPWGHSSPKVQQCPMKRLLGAVQGPPEAIKWWYPSCLPLQARHLQLEV